MELDKKIKVKKIFDCFSDFEEVKKYFNKAVYCADFIENFSNLERYTNTFIFKEFHLQECKPFVCSGQRYRFILPAEFVEQEKQYRPYTFMEFTDIFTVGRPIKYRRKGLIGWEMYLILNGYRHEQCNNKTITYIYIGSNRYTLDELFDNYEWQEHYTEDFQPFGVEVEE